MKILMIAPEFPPISGGISTYSYSAATSLDEMGHQVIVLTMAPKRGWSDVNQQGFTTINVSWLSKIYNRMFIQFTLTIATFFCYGAYIVKNREIDLIYCTRVDIGVSSRFISILFGVPYVLTIHGLEVVNPTAYFGRLLRFALKQTSAVTVLANRQRMNLLKLGVPDKKIHIIPMEIDLKKFHPDSRCEEIVDKFGLRGKSVILTVGKLVKRKGHDMVIKSLPKILKKVPNAVYFIIGKGPEEQNLRSLAEVLDLKDKVIFAGFVPDEDLLKYYNTCNVFIMPSREIECNIEGFGIVFLEANACSKPVIGGRSGGISDAIEEGVSGILVNPVDIDEISQTLITLLTDKELAETLGRQGWERVKVEFSYLAVSKKINEVFNSIKCFKKQM